MDDGWPGIGGSRANTVMDPWTIRTAGAVLPYLVGAHAEQIRSTV